MALAAFSQDKLLNMLRSAALLSPIAHLDHIQSQLAVIAADNFLAEVIQVKYKFIHVKRNQRDTEFFLFSNRTCTGWVFANLFQKGKRSEQLLTFFQLQYVINLDMLILCFLVTQNYEDRV